MAKDRGIGNPRDRILVVVPTTGYARHAIKGVGATHSLCGYDLRVGGYSVMSKPVTCEQCQEALGCLAGEV